MVPDRELEARPSEGATIDRPPSKLSYGNLVVAAFLLYFAYRALAEGIGGQEIAWTPTLIGSGLLALGLGVFWAGTNRWIAQLKLGQVSVDIGQGSTPIPITVKFPAKPSVRLNPVSATLIVKEEVQRGSGTRRTTYTHEVHRTLVRLSQRQIHPGVVTFQGEIPFQSDFPIPFYGVSNKLLWEVEVKVDVQDWPDWRSTYGMIARRVGV